MRTQCQEELDMHHTLQDKPEETLTAKTAMENCNEPEKLQQAYVPTPWNEEEKRRAKSQAHLNAWTQVLEHRTTILFYNGEYYALRSEDVKLTITSKFMSGDTLCEAPVNARSLTISLQLAFSNSKSQLTWFIRSEGSSAWIRCIFYVG
jgi:hypothetical protein